MNRYIGFNSACGDGDVDDVRFGRIEACDLVIRNIELKGFFTALSNYDNRKALGIKLFANKVDFLPAVVIIYTVACGRVSDLLNCVEAKLDRLGSVDVYIIGNGSIFLIGNNYRICTGYCHINCRRINGNILKSERLGLAALEGSVKSDAVKLKLFVSKVIYLTGSNKLKAALCRYRNRAIKREEEDILSTAVLTTCDSPKTLGNVDLDLNNRATIIVTCELDVVYCTIGSDNLSELGCCAAGAVLDKEAKLTCAGNIYKNLAAGATDLDGLGVLNSLKGLGSGSNLGAGYDGEHTIDIILGASAGFNIADVKLIVNILVFTCVNLFPLSVESGFLGNSVGGEVPSSAESLILVPTVELEAFLGRISRLLDKCAALCLNRLDSRTAVCGEVNVKLFDLGERNLFALVLNLYIEEVVSACKVTDVVGACCVEAEGGNSEIFVIELTIGLVKDLALVIPDSNVTPSLGAGVAGGTLTAMLPVNGNGTLAGGHEHDGVLPCACFGIIDSFGTVEVNSEVLRGGAAVGKSEGNVLALDTALLRREDNFKFASSYNLGTLNGSSMLCLGIKYDGCRGTCRSFKLCATDVTYIVFICVSALGKLFAANCTVVRAVCCCALGKLGAADRAVVAAVCRCTLGKLGAADRAVVAAVCCCALGKPGAADRAVVAAFCYCALGELFFTEITVVILVLILVLARSIRGVILFELCATVVADVVGISVYVLSARLVAANQVAKSGDLRKKITGGHNED